MMRYLAVLLSTCLIGVWVKVETNVFKGGLSVPILVKESEPLCFICRQPGPTETAHYGASMDLLHHPKCIPPEHVKVPTTQPYSRAVYEGSVPGARRGWIASLFVSLLVGVAFFFWIMIALFPIAKAFPSFNHMETETENTILFGMVIANTVFLTIWMQCS